MTHDIKREICYYILINDFNINLIIFVDIISPVSHIVHLIKSTN